MRRGIFLFIIFPFILTLFSSCGKSDSTNEAESILDLAQNEWYVVSSYDDLSFIISDDKITLKSPEILCGEEIYINGKTASSKLKGYEISLPTGFIKSISALYNFRQRLSQMKPSDIKIENGTIYYESCFIKIKENEFVFKVQDKEFIITKRTDKGNEKNISDS